MTRLSALLKPLKEFFIKHPAVLSGYLIYGYFFVSTMKFYRDFKESNFKNLEIVKNFDTLFWMWLLAFVLVKVLEYRTKLGEQEKHRLEQARELEIRQTQLETVHAMLRSLQHEINNPLTIIKLYMSKLERTAAGSLAVLKDVAVVKESAERIAKILRNFSNAQGYATLETSAGKLAQPMKEHDTP